MSYVRRGGKLQEEGDVSEQEQVDSSSSSTAWHVTTLIIALAALACGIAGIFLPTAGNDASKMHALFTRQQLNITLAGVCGDFPVDIIFSKIGSQATVQVPGFTCDGTVNRSELGLRFTLPDGFDADILFARDSAGDLAVPLASELAMWCDDVVGPGKRRGVSVVADCTVFNNSLAYVIGNVVYMGRSTYNNLYIDGTTMYGPAYGLTLEYFTTNNTAAPVSAAMPDATPPLLTLLLATTVALGTALA